MFAKAMISGPSPKTTLRQKNCAPDSDNSRRKASRATALRRCCSKTPRLNERETLAIASRGHVERSDRLRDNTGSMGAIERLAARTHGRDLRIPCLTANRVFQHNPPEAI